MSLLSTDAGILLLPGRALMGRGGRFQESAQGEGWDGALAGLKDLLRQVGAKGKVSVALSHHFAALHVFAPPAVRLPADEMQGWLREQLVRDFGGEAETWRLAWQDVAPGRPVPVTSMPEERYAALLACMAGQGASLAQLGPWAVQAWARHRGNLKGSAWLALAEPGRLALARVEGGRLVHVGMSRMDADPTASVPAQVSAEATRQALRVGRAPSGEILVLAPAIQVDPMPQGGAWRIRVLGPAGAGWGALLP